MGIVRMGIKLDKPVRLTVVIWICETSAANKKKDGDTVYMAGESDFPKFSRCIETVYFIKIR